MHRTLIVVLAALLFTVAGPPSAHAHGVLKRSEPAARSHLRELPHQIRLTFNEAPTLAFTRIALRALTGAVELTDVRIESDTIAVADIIGRLEAGKYTVSWQIAGADGHPVRGAFEFSIAKDARGLAVPADSIGGEPGAVVPAPTQTGPPAAHHAHAAQAGPRAFDAESPTFVAIRALLYLSIVAAIGAAVFRQLLLRRTRGAATDDDPLHIAADRHAASIGMWAARVAIIAAVFRLIAQSYAMHDGNVFDSEMLSSMLTQTLWGWGWFAQLVAALVAERAFSAARTGSLPTRPQGTAWLVATFSVVMLGLTPALASHAAAVPRLALLAIAADGLHVIAAGAWMGSLLLLIVAGIPAALAHRDTRAAVMWIRAFSPIALSSAAALAVTGAFAGWQHVGSTSALWTTPYGRTLLIKLAILGAVGAAGFYNWRFVLPRLHEDGELRMVSRAGAAELVFGALVVVITSVLVALPTS